MYVTNKPATLEVMEAWSPKKSVDTKQKRVK